MDGALRENLARNVNRGVKMERLEGSGRRGCYKQMTLCKWREMEEEPQERI